MEMLLAVFFVALPFLLGRVFCGYVCPLGFIVELTGPKKQPLIPTNLRKVLLPLPSFILIIALIFLLFGSSFYLIFDPLSILTRTSTAVLYPLLDKLARFVGDWLYLFKLLQGTVDTVTTFLSGKFIFQKPLSYQLQLVILIFFLTLILVSYWVRRLWCRHLCPLGALFGWLSRFSLWGRVVEEDRCIKCGKCESICPMDAVREEGLVTDKTRCQLSFECAEVCPTEAIHFGPKPKKAVYNPSRRAFVTVSGLAFLNAIFIKTSLSQQKKLFSLIRPPGAQEEPSFLALCCRCGQCMKVCPTNVLQPSLLAGGLEGIFTPEMNFNHAYCDFSCYECTKICPTGAIELLTLQEKQRTVIGRAYIDRNHCIPWADFENCLVCEELCPTPKKAIVFQEAKVKNFQGEVVTLKRPQVVAERCIGCGICQFACPVPFKSAIEVQSTSLALLDQS